MNVRQFVSSIQDALETSASQQDRNFLNLYESYNVISFLFCEGHVFIVHML